MLTRIEIDGFKTFRNFALDLQPFNVIAGANASGKSNLFDAIQLLARLAESDLRTAASSLRGEPHELFHRAADGSSADHITLAVEVLVEPSVRDPWGQVHDLIQTRIRYEVELQRRVERGLERLLRGARSCKAYSCVEGSMGSAVQAEARPTRHAATQIQPPERPA